MSLVMIEQKDNNVSPLGSTLFSDSETFMRDLSEQEESIISGGKSKSDKKKKKKKKKKPNRSRSRSRT